MLLGLTKKRLNIKKNIYIYLNFNRIALNCITIASLMQSRIAYKKMHMHRMSAYILFTSLLYRFLRHTYTLCVKRFFLFLSSEIYNSMSCRLYCGCFVHIAKLRQNEEEVAAAAAPEDQQDHFNAEPVGSVTPHRGI